jgi:polyphenol oxidase
MSPPTVMLQEVTRGDIRLLCPAERAAPVCFTDRNGGVSAAPFDSLNLAARVGDDAAAVSSNRSRVAEAAGFDLAKLRLAKQVHGADLIEVGEASAPVAGEADVLFTREAGVTLGILTADCTPVVVLGDEAVSIAHAGWRGLVAGAVEAALEAVENPRAAYVGPSIRACCYEVGPEVISAFEHRGLPIAAADRVDPGEAALAVLRRAGVPEVAVSYDCTSCDPRYFSYRRDGLTGRQGAFVTLPAP